MAYPVVPNVDLCLVADVQSFLGGEFAPSMADEIQREITAFSRLAASYCGRAFMSADYVEVRNGTGTGTLMLKAAPVTAVASVLADDTIVRVATSPGKGDGFSFNKDTAALYAGRCVCFPKGTQNIVISYTAGYINLVDPTTTTIPQDLRNSIVLAVADLFKKRTNIGVQSKSIAGETIVYGGIKIPVGVAMVWDQYQRAAYGY